ISHPEKEGHQINSRQCAFLQCPPHEGGITLCGFTHPLYGATDTHDSWYLNVDMPELQLGHDHLSGYFALHCQRIQPGHDEMMDTLRRRPIKKTDRFSFL